jgi:hypothetical protein
MKKFKFAGVRAAGARLVFAGERGLEAYLSRPARAWIWSVALCCILFLSGTASAHPGRLNSEGCHHVHDDYEYKNGTVLKAGDYHCHRTLGGDKTKGLRLDGFERLQDDSEIKARKKTK